jgi:hypothetical protein
VLATLTFVGSRPSWSGTLAEEQVDCTSAGTPLTIAPDTLDVIVTLDGGTINFSPLSREGASGCADFNFEGRVWDDQMFGTVKTTPVFCQGTYVEMRGTWQAQRESP